jgi:hypothetical protein
MTYSAAPQLTPALRTTSCAAETFRTGISRLCLRWGISPALLLAAALFFAAATPPAFAQHGGGGGGHAGGGGGGSHSGGGSATSAHVSSPSHTSSAKPTVASPTTKQAPSRPNDANPSYGSNRLGGVGSASAHSGGVAAGGSGSLSTARESFTAPRNVTIGFPPLTERVSGVPLTISSLAPGQHMSFYGDGGDVWQEPSRSQTVQSISQQHPARQVSTSSPAPSKVLQTAHAPLPAQTSGLTPKPRTSAVISEGPIIPRRPRNPIFSGFGGNGFGGRGFDPWFLGFGLDGLGGCDPTWAFGCNAFADPSPGYGWDSNADSNQMDDSISPQPLGDQIENVWQDPPTDSASMADEIAAEKSLVVLYLNDGSVYALTNYWVAGGKLHYETSYGADNSLDLGELDLQRTVNANAARGVEFTLRPAPEPKKAAPEPSQAPQTQPQQ